MESLKCLHSVDLVNNLIRSGIHYDIDSFALYRRVRTHCPSHSIPDAGSAHAISTGMSITNYISSVTYKLDERFSDSHALRGKFVSSGQVRSLNRRESPNEL